MRIRNPFAVRSPYAELEANRRQRLLIAITRATIAFTAPLIVIVGLMLLIKPSLQVLLALLFSAAIAPISLIARRLAQKGRVELASYLLVVSLLFINGVNSLLIEGLSSIVVPGYILLILVHGMVMGPRQSYIVTALAAVLFLVIQSITNLGLIKPAPTTEVLGVIAISVVSVLAFVMVAILNQLATSDLRSSLDDATYDLVQANQRLEDASEMKSQFTARTSHELRTPLSAIIVFTDLALREAYGPLNAKLKKSLNHVLDSARHLKTLINDILDLSKIEAGELEIFKEPFEVEKLVETVESTLGEVARQKKLDLSIEIASKMPSTVHGDESRIAQILINLTDNAVKFTEKGKVRILIEPVNESKWSMCVSDTGPGIPEENFESIFEAFRQFDPMPSSGKKPGTGLGLAITRHLVEILGGEIRLRSDIGRGSTFEVFLPLKVPELTSVAS